MSRLTISTIVYAALLSACASGGPRPGDIRRLTPEEVAALKPAPNPRVPLQEIVALSRSGAAADAIIKRLQETGTIHNLSAQNIIDLNTEGVDRKVIDYLGEAQEKARQSALATQLADRDAQHARELEQEQQRRRALQLQYENRDWNFGFGGWGPYGGFGWSPLYYYDWRFGPWRPWGPRR
jgi:hypothetical protein